MDDVVRAVVWPPSAHCGHILAGVEPGVDAVEARHPSQDGVEEPNEGHRPREDSPVAGFRWPEPAPKLAHAVEHDVTICGHSEVACTVYPDK